MGKFVFSLLLFMFPIVSFGAIKVVLKADRIYAAADVEIVFEATASSNAGKIQGYSWDFGDGKTAKTKIPTITHRYAAEGIFKVKLTVSDLKDEVLTELSVSIVKNEKPIADFYSKFSTFEAGQTISFVSQSKDVDQKIEKLEWSIDTAPATVGIGPYFETKIKVPGDYLVTLKVTDALGSNSTKQKKIAILARNEKPKVSFLDEPEVVEARSPFTVRIKASDADGKIEKVFWRVGSFPEVETGELKREVMIPREGSYLIEVRVVDDRGASTSIQQIVYAEDTKQIPEISLKVRSKKIVVNDKVMFSVKMDRQTKKLRNIEWDFGDGNLSAAPHMDAVHTYASAGEFEIVAKVIFADGDFSEVKDKVTVAMPLTRLLTTPSQVVINDLNYIEIIPTQKLVLDFSAYSGISQLYSFSSVTWNISSSNVTLFSTSGNAATIQGSTAGDSIISVSVDGKTSQDILIRVLGFSSDAVVTQRGKFFGSRRSTLCNYINRTVYSAYWSFKDDLWNGTGQTSSGEGSDKIGFCRKVSLPVGTSTVNFTATQASTTLSAAKTGIQHFDGRNGFLLINNASTGYQTMNVTGSDERFLRLDEDFSLTFWSYVSANSSVTEVWLNGDIKVGYNMAGDIDILGTGGYTRLFSPKDSEYREKWHHIALTFSAQSRELKFFIDGEYHASTVIPSTGTSGDQTIQVKGYGPFNINALDELRFWSKALTATEVSSELFSPVSSASPDLLGVFSFDAGFSPEIVSDNGSNWKMNLSSSAGAKEPQVAYPPKNIISQTIVAGQRTVVNAKVPFAEYGRAELEVVVDAGDFSTNQMLRVDVGTCVADCAYGASVLRSNRLSPIFHFAAMDVPVSPIVARFPFDPRSLSDADLAKIKVVRWNGIGWGDTHSVFEPLEINKVEGYVRVELGGDTEIGGDYWIAVPVGHSGREIQYSNTDLLPNFRPYIGFRSFAAQVPNATTTYTLTSAIGSSAITYVACSQGGYIPDTYLPITLPSQFSAPAQTLPTGYTVCDLFLRHLSYTSDEYESFDRVVILRSAP